jgi:hypothetical protein
LLFIFLYAVILMSFSIPLSQSSPQQPKLTPTPILLGTTAKFGPEQVEMIYVPSGNFEMGVNREAVHSRQLKKREVIL